MPKGDREGRLSCVYGLGTSNVPEGTGQLLTANCQLLTANS